MAKAIGDARVSSNEQAISHLGIEAQRAAIQAAATKLNVSLVAIHEDAGLSGALDMDDRPGLLAAVEAVRRGDVLLVAKRDRLGRDVVGVALIERAVVRRGGRVVSGAGEGTESDDPQAKLIRGITDLFSAHERWLVSARTKAALKAKRVRGERAGAEPFGFSSDVDGRLEPVQDEQAALKLIRELRAAGASYPSIAKELEAKGIPAKRGGSTWHASSVRSILRTAEAAGVAAGA